MIEIDGSYGEGGGQILRTSLALSVLSGKSFKISRIRAGRKVPGLRPQHLMSAQGALQISRGRMTGADLGSQELTFYPGQLQSGNYLFDVGTVTASAGSTTLIFQTVFLPLGFARHRSRITIKGGTHVPWSPSVDYLKDVFSPTIAKMGMNVSIASPRKGFYPIGGGILEATIDPFKPPLRPLHLQARGNLKQIRILSSVANLPLSIAKRQIDRCMDRLLQHGLQPRGETRTDPSPGKGTCCFILAEFENVIAGFSSLGEIGKRAEQVADEAVESFLHFWNGYAALDPHLGDQVVLLMGLAEGESSITVSEMTNHLKTNIWTIEKFLPLKFILESDPSKRTHRVRVKGAAWQSA